MTVDALEYLRTQDPVPHGSAAPPMERVLAFIERTEAQPEPRRERRRPGFPLVPALAVVAALAVVGVVVVLAVTHRGQPPSHMRPATPTAPTVPSPQSLMPRGGMRGALAIQGAASPAPDAILINFSQCPECRPGASVDPSRFWQAFTFDGGRSWQVAPTSLDLTMLAVGRADAWAQGAGADRTVRFFASHDHGRTWHVAASPDPALGYGNVSIAGGKVWSLGNGCVGTRCSDAVLRAPASGNRLKETTGQPPLGHGTNVSVVAATGDAAYVLTNGTSDSPQARVFATHDGGRTWRPMPSACPARASGTLYAGGIDSLWVLCEPTRGPTEVRRSTDGGGHWATLGARAVGDQLYPASAQVVWATTPTGKVFRTVDGGRTWTRVWFAGHPEASAPTNAPPGLNRSWNMFLTAQSPTTATVIVQVTRGNGHAGQTDFVTYTTTDGGRTWHPSAVRLPAG